MSPKIALCVSKGHCGISITKYKSLIIFPRWEARLGLKNNVGYPI